MRILISLIFTLPSFFVSIIIIFNNRDVFVELVFFAIIFNSLVYVITYANTDVKSGRNIAIDTINRIKDTKEAIESSVEGIESEFLAIAEQECDEGKTVKGLWSQALVKAKGNENLRKVEYMKLRAKQLKKINY